MTTKAWALFDHTRLGTTRPILRMLRNVLLSLIFLAIMLNWLFVFADYEWCQIHGDIAFNCQGSRPCIDIVCRDYSIDFFWFIRD